jgi:hypothetical protein
LGPPRVLTSENVPAFRLPLALGAPLASVCLFTVGVLLDTMYDLEAILMLQAEKLRNN